MRRVFALAVLASACSGSEPRLETPADRSFVRGGAAIPVRVRVDGDRAAATAGDGIFVELTRDAGGAFAGNLPPLSPGEHVVTVYRPDAPGATVSSRIYVDRLPLAPVDGWGFSADASWVVTLSKRRSADDGLASGALELTDVDVPTPSRRLSEDGSFAEVSGTHVAWVEGWGGGAGTLRLARLTDHLASAPAWPDTREIRFSPNGALAARDEGLVLFRDSFEAPERVATESDAFFFAGPFDDLVSFAAIQDTAFRATFVDGVSRRITAVAPPVRAAARNPALREIALLEAHAPRALVTWDFWAGELVRGPLRVRAAEYSRDGTWLASLDELGALTISNRSQGMPFEPIAGAFTGAAFDAASARLFALSTGGVLVEAALGDPISASAVASGVADFAPLAEGAVVWYDQSFTLHVRTTAGAVVPVGALHPTRPEVVLGSNGLRFAFTTPAGQVRIVDAVTGAWVDFGSDASRPTFLGSAIAWLERRADAEDGGLANHDLWLFAEFPGSLLGPMRVAERVKSDQSLPKSFAEDRIAVLADLPRRGERWAARAVCVRSSGDVRALGAADAKMRFLFFLPDGRIARFGPDGKQEQAMFLDRCD